MHACTLCLILLVLSPFTEPFQPSSENAKEVASIEPLLALRQEIDARQSTAQRVTLPNTPETGLPLAVSAVALASDPRCSIANDRPPDTSFGDYVVLTAVLRL